MVISVRPVQPLNADLPMLATELGIVMFVRFVQLENELSPMLVTELGMVISVRPVQLDIVFTTYCLSVKYD